MSAVKNAESLGSIESLRTSWGRRLRAANLSPRTSDGYLLSARLLDEYLHERGMPIDVHSITREHVEAFIQHLLDTRASATGATRYRDLQQC